ncbi:MAG: ATP-grasp domain-containing protein [Phycisphaerae bacterium]
MFANGFNILFTSCGRRVSLINAFRDVAGALGEPIRIVGADMAGDLCAASSACDFTVKVPPVKAKGYLEALAEIVRTRSINLIIPTTDLDLLLLAENRQLFGGLGCEVFVPEADAVRIARDKRKTVDFFLKHGFNAPNCYRLSEIPEGAGCRFFLKPWDGSASTNTVIVDDYDALLFYSSRIPKCVIQEYIAGTEYTTDVYVNSAGKAVCAVPRERIAVRAGEVSIGRTCDKELLISENKRLAEALSPGFSVLTIQSILTESDNLFFIEINARFGGGVPLTVKSGANYPLWLLEEYSGRPSSARQQFEAGLTMLRYEAEVWQQKDNSCE